MHDLDFGRKPEWLEKSHATSKFHTERTEQDLNPGPYCWETMLLTTTPPTTEHSSRQSKSSSQLQWSDLGINIQYSYFEWIHGWPWVWLVALPFLAAHISLIWTLTSLIPFFHWLPTGNEFAAAAERSCYIQWTRFSTSFVTSRKFCRQTQHKALRHSIKIAYTIDQQ